MRMRNANRSNAGFIDNEIERNNHAKIGFRWRREQLHRLAAMLTIGIVLMRGRRTTLVLLRTARLTRSTSARVGVASLTSARNAREQACCAQCD